MPARKTAKKDNNRRPLAVVTSAASGIGYELAKQFAAQGYDLLITDEEQGIQRAAQQLGKMGAAVKYHHLDLSAPKGVESFYKHIQADGRPVAALAISNGVGVGGEFTHGDAVEAELHLARLGLVSTVHLSRLVLAGMKRRGEGRLLFTSSLMVTDPGPYRAVYTATKAFLHAYTRALREELEGTGVCVSSLLPGDTDTSFFPYTGTVARQGYDALMEGKDKVVEGTILGRLLNGVANLLPHRLVFNH